VSALTGWIAAVPEMCSGMSSTGAKRLDGSRPISFYTGRALVKKGESACGAFLAFEVRWEGGTFWVHRGAEVEVADA
jgi:hypothetical protein